MGTNAFQSTAFQQTAGLVAFQEAVAAPTTTTTGGGPVRGEIAWNAVIPEELLRKLRAQSERFYELRDSRWRSENEQALRAVVRESVDEALGRLKEQVTVADEPLVIAEEGQPSAAPVHEPLALDYASYLAPTEDLFREFEVRLSDFPAQMIDLYRQVVAAYREEMDEEEMELELLLGDY